MSAELFSTRNLREEDFFLLNGMDWSPRPKDRDSIFLLVALDHAALSLSGTAGASRTRGSPPRIAAYIRDVKSMARMIKDL